ncbi:MAG: Hpt domain-containing protein [Planctomycetota bacterium]
MLLLSPPPDRTINQAFDFSSHLDQQTLAGRPPHRTIHHQTHAEILESVAEMAEVRPVVFDRKQTLARLGGMEDLLMEVLEVMRTESPKLHAQIDAAFARRNATDLKRAAHTLKGSASIVGAWDLVARLRRVEELAAESNLDAVAVELPEIDRQFNALKCCLDDELMAHA